MRVRRYPWLSEVPGLSVLTRDTLRRLEGGESAEEVVDDWHRVVADGMHPWFDLRDGECGVWACCPPTVGIRTLLVMLEPGLRRADRERLYGELRWVEGLG
ncbi:hypothetical protein [Kribbella sp. NPDC051770]|uniref:hypothetical protein n=1 Tax=Kribbella sp. NPDC051770 TaxID=3155413 RepID=UPI00341DFE50